MYSLPQSYNQTSKCKRCISSNAYASVKLITDRETRRSKGFAFVEMPNDGEAKEAIKQLNGAEYVNRTMVVKEALPKA